MKLEAIKRIEADIREIRKAGDRTGELAKKNLRWIGEPKGWRTMGELADDLELVLKAGE